MPETLFPSIPSLPTNVRCRVVLLGLLLLLGFAGPLRAYTPIYTVKKQIALSDLANSGSPLPMSVTGLNDSGRLVGFYSYTTKVRGLTTTSVQVLAWDDSTQNELNVLASLNTTAQGMATGVSATGWIGGVCWTSDLGDPGSSGQWGFVWIDGTLTTFAAPDGSDIDTVVAVNNQGQAIGTYFGSAGYKRAFFWDGNTSTDLGDLGDPDNSFVWPVSLNDAGQVAGTLYDESNPIGLPPTTAFVWTAATGMSAVDADGVYQSTSAAALNSSGEIVGGLFTPPPKGGHSPVPGGFLWNGSQITPLPGLPGGGDPQPFSLDDDEDITGTAYADDNTLHLFQQWGGNVTDLGAAQLTAGDQSFQLNSVSTNGDMTGLVADANGNPQAFVRTAGALWNLAAVMPPSLGFAASNANGTQVLVNSAGWWPARARARARRWCSCSPRTRTVTACPTDGNSSTSATIRSIPTRTRMAMVKATGRNTTRAPTRPTSMMAKPPH